ncbi:uncharacterized protein C1orf141 homolog [Notamacropus eugenii]|uniref:uncharacterized protein C1orf141 homolog n=1 Tax=Notamacropus eugenii TaxID=9315 RepID=UPI003B6787BD
MTERLLEKLTAMDKRSEKVMDMRTLKCRMQNINIKKNLHIPLTFDFHTGFEKPCPKSIAAKLKESSQKEQFSANGQKMDTKLTSGLNAWKPKLLTSGLLPRKCLFGKANIRPYSVPGNLKYQPLEESQLSEAPEQLKSVKPFLYPKSKDKAETGHMMPWLRISQPIPLSFRGPALDTTEFCAPYYQSSYGEKERKYADFPGTSRTPCQKFGTIPDTIGILPKDGMKKRKKAIAQKDATSLGRSRWFKNVPPPGRDLENETTHLIPLSIEDELNKPNAKIISLRESKHATAPPILSRTNPIIFHDTGYVQMFLLTRNKYYLKNKEKPISGKTNLVLKKNNEIIKTLISDPLTATFCPKGMFLDQWKIEAKVRPREAENLMNEETQKKTNFPSVQVAGDDYPIHRVSLESEKSSEDWTPKPSKFQYSSNARHSKYLQNFSTVRNTVRMTHLDNLLNRKPPQILQIDKVVTGIQYLRTKPQAPSTFKYNEKFPGLAFESKTPMRGAAEQIVNIGAEEEQAPTFGKSLFLTSLDETKNWMREKAAVSGLSSQSNIKISLAQ